MAVATLAHVSRASNILTPTTPLDLLYRGLSIRAEAPALEDWSGVRTFSQLVTDIEALAAAFQAMDPECGTRVGICAHNTREHVTALLATYAAGKVWVPLNPRNGRTELDAMIALTAPGIIVADESCTARFTPTRAPLVLGRRDIAATRANGHPTIGVGAVVCVDELITRYRDAKPATVARRAADAAIIKFSGGTTGTPKAVVQPLRALQAQAEGLATAFAFSSDDRILLAAPLTHGTSCFVLPLLGAGATLVIPKRVTAATILDAFETDGITTTYLPPSLIYAMLAEPGVRERRFPRLRHLIYSAQAMPAERIRDARKVFGPVIETAYGQVEAPQIISALRADEMADDANIESVGRPSSVAEVAIMGPNRAPVPRGVIGEVVVRGDLVMTGYLARPDLTAETIINGWLHTGDLGFMDERGFLFLKGRLREVIISGGFNVFPADVEAVLSRHPAVQDCCVFGVPSDKWGEAVHAAVVLRATSVASETELMAFVKTELDAVKTPKGVHFVAALPRNAAGKVARRSVRTMILEEDPGEEAHNEPAL